MLLEIIMIQVGYFHYINCNLLKSISLDIGGFIAVLWLDENLDATVKGLGKRV